MLWQHPLAAPMIFRGHATGPPNSKRDNPRAAPTSAADTNDHRLRVATNGSGCPGLPSSCGSRGCLWAAVFSKCPSLSAVPNKLPLGQRPILPELQCCQKNDGCTEHEMPNCKLAFKVM